VAVDLVLPPNLADFVTSCVNSGRYATPNDVYIAGLRLLRACDRYRKWLDRELQTGIDDLQRGGCVEFNCEDDFIRFFNESIELLRSRYSTPTQPSEESDPVHRDSIAVLTSGDYLQIESEAMRGIVADRLSHQSKLPSNE
jgi:putative addiction module CopG family antidote